ncbi:YdeI/OmpD-associated family protein [Angustibacter speluncae]
MSPVPYSAETSTHPETLQQWRTWLAEHHARGAGVWVVQWKRATGRPAVGYEELVVEALAWGWIDSTNGTVDAGRSRMWFAPRRPTSGWARPNKLRVERLLAEGRMQPAGRAAIDVARANGAWTLLDDVEDLVVPDDLASALAEHPGARETWDAFPRTVRRAALVHLVEARRPDTRARRVGEVAGATARGERPVRP